ncbi:MAG: hypothetical protein KDE34_24060, partial [Anaerolineales bacterium]|nr:hypothetical protein [Anaerolineales bacterium]
MLRIRRYLKPYLPMLLVSIVLLFAQANLDLTLPDYLSKIVNTGIQQSGVDSVVPTALRATTLDHLLLFLPDADQTIVRDAYTLVEPGSAAAGEHIEAYPLLADEAIYVLNDIDGATRDTLESPLSRALLVVTALNQAMADPEVAAQLGGGEFNLSQLPPGTDVYALLARMPADQRATLASGANERFASLGANMTAQLAIAAVRAEYEALNVDINGLQTSYILRTGGLMLLITLLSVVCTISVGYLSAQIAAGVGRDLRSDIFTKVESFSSAEFDKFPTASLITRSTNDITQLQMVTMFMVRLVFYAPIMGVGGIIRAVGKGSSMWWTIAVAVLVLIGLIITLVSIALPKFKIVQKLIDRL